MLKDVIEKTLGLRNTGRDVMEVSHKNIEHELRHYTRDESALWVSGCNLISKLRMPFKAMIDVVFKILLSHVGNHTMLNLPH